MAALGREAEARIHYRRALQLAPADAPSWLNLGNLERRAARGDSAMAFYRRAEAADSGFVPALRAQIQLLGDAKRGPEVVEVYRRWLRPHPDHHGARLEAIRLLDETGREDEALALARDGTEQVRDSGQPHLILGMLLRGHGDTRGALVALRRAEALFRDCPAEHERVVKTIAALRASAPDSLHAMFAADSVAAEKRRQR
jgi:tetratricopeptide (TPR) repeat protein